MEYVVGLIILAAACYFTYKVVVGSDPLDDARKAADLNKDGSVDVKDVVVAAEKVKTRAKRVTTKAVDRTKARSKKK